MSVFMVEEEMRSGRLVIVPGIEFGIRSTLRIGHLRQRTLSQPARRLSELLLEHDADLIIRERELMRTVERHTRG